MTTMLRRTLSLFLPLIVPAALMAQKPTPKPLSHPKLAQLPLSFEANQGQTNPAVQYLARSQGSVVFLTHAGAVVKAGTSAVALTWMGAQGQSHAIATEPGTPTQYLTAAYKGAVSTFGRIAYHGLYPGVDVAYYGQPSALEYDLTLAPGANASALELKVQGATARIGTDGSLQLGTALRFSRPVAYQQIAGQRRAVAARYTRRDDGTIGFALGAYDHSQALILDPVLAWATYLGGTQFNQANAVAVDSTGAAYVTGTTQSADFPIVGGVQTSLHAGNFDAFVAKLSTDGTKLTYSTYLGGTLDDEATGIAVDASGNAYVTGFTDSTDFPATAGAFQASYAGGNYRAFVAKLNAAGSALTYATYLGGSGGDRAAGIAVDGSGDAFVAGSTSSADFPASGTAPQTTLKGSTNAFVAAINPAGSALLWATYLGGSAVDRGQAIALDQSGNVYAGGSASSANFPTTPGALQPANAGSSDGFVVRINRSGRALDYATYLGGTKSDEVNGIAVDAAGNAFVTGDTVSINFPVTSNGAQPNADGSGDAFVDEINPNGSGLVFGSYLGGSGNDVGTGIAVDSADEAFVAGYTSSSDFPTTSNATQSANGGVKDAFLTKFNAVGQAFLFSSYIGGLNNDSALGIGLDANGDLYVVGVTNSPNFPITTGVVQAASNSINDAFIAKFQSAAQGVFSPSTLGFPAQAVSVASTSEAVLFTNGGEKPLVISSIAMTGPYTETDTCSTNSSTLQPGTSCTLTVVFKPTATGAQNGTLVVNDNGPGGSQTLQLSGSGGTFTLSASPTTITITAGASASFALNVTPAAGYTQVVTLTCGMGTLTESTCTPSPTTLTMNGSATSTATYTVDTTARPTLVPPVSQSPRGPWFWLLLAALVLTLSSLLILLARGARRNRIGFAGAALLLGWALAASACGGGTTNPGTQPGNFTITLTATAGSTVQNQPVTLTVN